MMSEQPLISVIIPTYNSGYWVAQAVQSALAQTYTRVEVIVVDDGSTDDTKERLAPWGSRIRYVSQENGGPSKARNRGIKEAQGDLVAFLDADDFWLPEKLAKQWGALRANSDVALVHTDVYQLYEPASEQVYLYRRRERFSGRCYTEFFWGNRVHTSTVMVTRRCLDQIGSFDESIHGASTEDLDLWIRIARQYSLAYVNEPLVFYRHHPSNGSLNQRVMAENEHYVLAKALKVNCGLNRTLDWGRIRQRMFELAFQAGYSNVNIDNLLRARRYFREALYHNPFSTKVWAFWASTFLPLRLRKSLRFMKQRLWGSGDSNTGLLGEHYDLRLGKDLPTNLQRASICHPDTSSHGDAL
jgi:glycosyltransferase involved in cell wall biosynthesis